MRSFVVPVGPAAVRAKRVAVDGASHDDVIALQTRLGDSTTQLSAAVAQCTTLDEGTKLAWFDVAKRSVQFVSTAVPIVGDVTALYSQGLLLQTELSLWPARLKAAGCTNVPVGPAPAPAPAPLPSPGGFGGFGGLLGDIGAIAPLLIGYLILRELKL